MATAKQPRFPDPPLEVGVAQYPTPNVPDFYTKDGHIVLVEKVSAEKGAYNPQPLDGSVVYNKRDAGKWPDTLYLVYQQPSEDGKFVLNFWANDRTLASQDPWNFGLDYSSNNPAFPIVTRTYIVPRSQYATVALGSVDPVFGGAMKIASQKKEELPDGNPLRSRYVAVQRVYETIPGPVLTGKQLTERGEVETVSTQVVVAGTNPDADGLLVTQTNVQAVDAVKSLKTTGTVANYATLSNARNQAGLLGTTSISDNIVAAGTSADSVSMTVIDSTVEAISATKSRKRTTTSTGPSSLSGNSKKEGLLGEVSVVESIVAAGASSDNLSTTVISSEVTPIDSAKSKKTTITSVGPTVLDGKSMQEFGIATAKEQVVTYGTTVVPVTNTIKVDVDPIDSFKSKLTELKYDAIETLNGYQYDPDLNLIISTTKELIAEDTAPPAITNGLLSYRDEPINAWQTVRIQSRISSLPANRVEYKTGSYSSPNLLTGLNSSVFNFPDGQLQYNVTPVMRAQRSYQTAFKYETTYQYGQPTEPSYTLFDPLAIHVIYSGFFFSIDIPNCLTVGGLQLYFNTGINTATSNRYGSISEYYNVPVSTTLATDYLTAIGTYQLISYEIDYWKANIWRVVRQFVLLK
jgi:hypothetical protein